MAMILSIVIIAAVPTSAVDGDWTVVARPEQERGELSEDKHESVAGYYYDATGFHMTAANWGGQTPLARFVSKAKIDLKDGVYMEIVIDEFTSENVDCWYSIMLTDEQIAEPGKGFAGEAVENLIRPNVPVPNTTTWYLTGDFKQQYDPCDNVPVVKNDAKKDVLEVAIAWEEGTYTYTINGVSAPEVVITYMNQKWGENSEVYVGFCLQHTVKDGTVAASLVKYGHTKDDAAVPAGDDHEDPIDNSTNFVAAPVVENPTFEAGKPGIFMNGDVEGSDLKVIPTPVGGETITVNEDGSFSIVAANKCCPTGVWTVKNETSYAIEDLPIVMMVTKNLCTCTEDDKYDGLCGAMEESDVYLMTGDNLKPNDDFLVDASVSWDAYAVGDDTYLSMIVDASEMGSLFSGRINAVRFDIRNVNTSDPAASRFDVCFVAFFATEEDANAFFEAYLTNLGWENPDAGEDDVTTEEETTAVDETTGADETPGAEDVTTAPQGGSTAPAKKGCGSVVGFGAVAVVAVASVAGFVSFKKKED